MHNCKTCISGQPNYLELNGIIHIKNIIALYSVFLKPGNFKFYSDLIFNFPVKSEI